MPLFLTLLISKTIQRVSRLLGRGGGSALPGLVAEKLDPNILAKITRSLPEGSIVVTGTNGKTTTTKMLAAILTASGKRVLTNRSGSNLTRGIVSSVIEAASLSGKLAYDVGLFEVDEASMAAVCNLMQPNKIVVLNLFRDQLDRYGELDQTAKMVGKGIEQTSAEVFLNADDPLVSSLSKYAKAEANVWYFGVQSAMSVRLEHDLAADSDHCPICGRALVYSKNWFGHIGHYRCEKGHFDRPKPDYGMIETHSGLSGEEFEVKLPEGNARFSIELPGLYNAYNALAAIAVGNVLNISGGRMAAALHSLSAAFGRVEKIELRGRTIYLLLIKNPTGFNQVIQTFLAANPNSPHAKRGTPIASKRNANGGVRIANILIAINDNFADGRDVSWLWDVGVEELANSPHAKRGTPVASDSEVKRGANGGVRMANSIIVSGIRAYDMATRLKYAEIECKVESQLSKALVELVQATPEGATAYILPTYTAMLDLRQLITKEAGLEGFWK